MFCAESYLKQNKTEYHFIKFVRISRIKILLASRESKYCIYQNIANMIENNYIIKLYEYTQILLLVGNAKKPLFKTL